MYAPAFAGPDANYVIRLHAYIGIYRHNITYILLLLNHEPNSRPDVVLAGRGDEIFRYSSSCVLQQ